MTKYIVFNQRGFLTVHTFPEHINHSDVRVKRAFPRSAGFFWVEGGVVIVPPKGSVSLKLQPHPDDVKLIQDQILLGIKAELSFEAADAFEAHFKPGVEIPADSCDAVTGAGDL